MEKPNKPLFVSRREVELVGCFVDALKAMFDDRIVDRIYNDFYKNCKRNKFLTKPD